MNFREFEELANSGIKQINLTEDVLGDGEYIEIDANGLIIDGRGHAFDGNNESSILRINSNVTLRNVFFKNGYCEDSGGAILNNGDLTVENCRFEDNTSDEFGGAIYNNSRLAIQKSLFVENRSDYGGAIFIDLEAILTLDDSVFVSNSSEFEGGAIYNKAGLSVSSSSFRNNAAYKGGAIYNEDVLNIKNSDFKGNIAGYGNDIESENRGNLNILDCRFLD